MEQDNKNGTKIKKLRNTLITIISTIVISNIINPIYNNIIIIGDGFVQVLKNSIYSTAANVTEYTFSLWVVSLFLGCLVGLVIPLLIECIGKIYKSNRNEEGIANTQNDKENLEINETFDLINNRNEDVEEIHKNIEKLAEAIKKNDRIINRIKLLSSALILFFVIFFSFYVFIPNGLKSAYNISITKVTPYISIEELNKLNSDWTRMIEEEDYIKIDSILDKIVKENNL